MFSGDLHPKKVAHFPCRPFPVFLQFSWELDFGIITASHPSFRPPGQTSRPVLWSSFFVTLVAKKNSAYQFMLPSLLHMGFDNHYNCVDEHDYNQRMQILLPFDRVFPLL